MTSTTQAITTNTVAPGDIAWLAAGLLVTLVGLVFVITWTISERPRELPEPPNERTPT